MHSIKKFCHIFTSSDNMEFQARAFDDNLLCSTPDPPVTPGLVLLDSVTSSQYLVLRVFPINHKSRVVYLESMVQRINATASILRFIPGGKNSFGRDADPAPQLIIRDIPAFIEAGSASLKEAPDGPHPTGKLTATIPAADVQVGDRITTNQQEAFQVTGVDRYTNPGCYTLTLSPDNR